MPAHAARVGAVLGLTCAVVSDKGDPLATRRQLADAGYWFGPRSGTFGWGWTPVSWEGWAATALAIAALIAPLFVDRGPSHRGLYVLAVAGVLVGICFWKGTAPGPSRRATAQLREVARQHQR